MNYATLPGVNVYTFVALPFIKELIMAKAEVITDGNADKFIKCIANHRFWNREEFRKVPA